MITTYSLKNLAKPSEITDQEVFYGTTFNEFSSITLVFELFILQRTLCVTAFI